MTRTLVATALSSRLDSMPIVGANTDGGIRVAIASSATTSAALTGGVYMFCPSVACYVAISAAPTATTGAANLPLFGACLLPLMVPDGHKVSVIRSTEDGYLHLVPVTEG
jgi:hypothetical protein